MWYKTCAKKMGNGIKELKGCLYRFWDCLKTIKNAIEKNWNLFWGWACRISVRVWRFMYLCFIQIIRWFSYALIIIVEQRQFDVQMIKHGTLFLSSGLIFLGIKSTDKNISTGIIPAPPDSWSTVLRATISVVIFALIIFIFWILRKYEFISYIKKRIVIKILFFLVIGSLILFALWLLPLIPASGTSAVGLGFCAVSGIFAIAVFIKWLSIKLTDYIETKFPYFYWAIFWAVFIIGWWNGLGNIFTAEATWPLVVGFLWFILIGIQLLRSARQTKF